CSRIRGGQESSEELRCQLIGLLRALLRRSSGGQEIHKSSNDIIETCGMAMQDTCPDVKKEACDLVGVMADTLQGDKVLSCSAARETLVAALVRNTRHQQWRVRQRTLMAIRNLMLMRATFKLKRGPDCLISAGPPVPQLMFFAHAEEITAAIGGAAADDGLVRDRNEKVRATLVDFLEGVLVSGAKLDGQNLKAAATTTDEEDASLKEAAREMISTLTPEWEGRVLSQLMVMVGDDKVSARALEALRKAALCKREAT
ncbi:HEAT repeat-containing protein 2, partial [Perkinsus olseni]